MMAGRMSILKIKVALEAERILSPAGMSTWSKRTIDMILSNKKHCGSSIAKSGKALYEIENHHEPIISLDLFERVQTAKAERTNIEVGEDGRKIRRRTKYSSQKAPDND
jgi:site-specific DNA recombinase